jgi:hypothetical protein
LNSVINSGNSSCVEAGQLKLKLREPNLKFKLIKPKQNADDPSIPVRFAHVSVSVGNWYTWAQSSNDGSVNLFIDEEEIASKNPSFTGSHDVQFRFHTPGGSSDMVSWNCASGDNQPVCSELPDVIIGSEYLSTPRDLGTVQFKAPNTRVKIVKPKSLGDAGEGAHVVLFKHESGWKRWIASGNTGLDSIAAFNVEGNTTATRYSIDIYVPWRLRGAFTQKTYEDLTFEELSSTNFSLAEPNLTMTIKQSSGALLSKWAWVQVEEVHPTSYSTIRWQGGYGADELGVATFDLTPNKTFRLTVNPGPDSVGTRTSCIVTVNSSAVVSKVANQCAGQTESVSSGLFTLTLSAGNVQGYVLRTGTTTPVEGAIVIAEAFNNDGVAQNLIQTSNTDESGKYGFQLDPIYTWRFRVVYVNVPSTVVRLRSIQTAVTQSGVIPGLNSGTSLNQDFSLDDL